MYTENLLHVLSSYYECTDYKLTNNIRLLPINILIVSVAIVSAIKSESAVIKCRDYEIIAKLKTSQTLRRYILEAHTVYHFGNYNETDFPISSGTKAPRTFTNENVAICTDSGCDEKGRGRGLSFHEAGNHVKLNVCTDSI